MVKYIDNTKWIPVLAADCTKKLDIYHNHTWYHQPIGLFVAKWIIDYLNVPTMT